MATRCCVITLDAVAAAADPNRGRCSAGVPTKERQVFGRRPGDGAEESFRAFVAARRPALLRTAWLLTGNRDDAEDLVQTALVAVARHWSRVTAAGDPEPYVRRALVTAHVSAWRSAGRRTRVDPPPTDRSEPDPDDRLVLAAALGRLTARQRAVLVLRFYEDLTETQTAQVLGIGVGTVKSQTRHALGRLRALAPELAEFAPAAAGPLEVTS